MCARFARVAETLFADWIKVNTHGSDYDGSYEVMADGPRSVRWTRVGQPARSYRVRVTLGGVAVGCECKGWKYGRKCVHVTLTTGLIARGKFKLPADVQESLECMAEAEYQHTTECE
jgi:hypothetical protein